jgi:hypothetical protein
MAFATGKKHSLEAMKTLVALHGTRKAARVSGIPYGTLSAMAFKFRWKKAKFKEPENQAEKDAADVVKEEIQQARKDSELNLARYVDNASKEAAKHKQPLEVARKVRDVAGVYQVLYPPDEEGGLIEGAILLGEAAVTNNPREVELSTLNPEPSTLNSQLSTSDPDVRPELPDAGPESH